MNCELGEMLKEALLSQDNQATSDDGLYRCQDMNWGHPGCETAVPVAGTFLCKIVYRTIMVYFRQMYHYRLIN
jgi:hypothetical protein